VYIPKSGPPATLPCARFGSERFALLKTFLIAVVPQYNLVKSD